MKAWENFLNGQETELGKDIVAKWLRPLKVVHFDACNLYLQAADSFQIHWFEEHIRKRAYQIFRNNNQKKIQIHLSVSPHSNELASSKKRAKKAKEKQEVEVQLPKFAIAFDEIDPHATLDRLYVGKYNELPFKLISKTVGYDFLEKRILPGNLELANYNPIYLCGPSGVGKTHLLMGAVHVLRDQGLSVIYVRAETFTEHVVKAIRAGEMNLFRQSYRNADVLIIEDAHIFARKAATQEELFHTFNTLHINGKQIIISANCLPSELQFVEPRLISRFEWGVVVPIAAPTKEDMRQLLQTKAETLQSPLHPKISEFLLETFTSSCKAVVKALEALILRAHMDEKGANIRLTFPLARQYLTDLIAEEQKIALNAEKVIHCVTEFFGMRMEDILGKGQSRECVLPRQMSMYICRTLLKMPFMRIGELFEKDHSTVMSSVKLIQKGIDDNDVEMVSSYNAIMKKLRP